jgi:radical SAM protein with 4Fe4S-binding SPASM domain
VQFFPTLRCNRSCGFCFNRGLGTYRDTTIADFERLLRALTALTDAGIRDIDLLGGEPTLHPGFPAMLSMLRHHGLTATFSTNGSRPDILEDFASGNFGGSIRAGVSLNEESISPELHGFILRYTPMVKGIFRKGAGLPAAMEPYLPHPEIESYVLYADAVAREDLGTALPFHEFHSELGRLQKEGARVGGVHCGFLPLHDDPAHGRTRCSAGTTKLSILPDGSVYPCYLFFRDRRFLLGNIFTDGFDTIWESPVLGFFRTFEGNACPHGECPLHASCRGGCPAVSLLMCGDIQAPDARCVPPSGVQHPRFTHHIPHAGFPSHGPVTEDYDRIS